MMLIFVAFFEAASQYHHSSVPFFTHYNYTDYHLHGPTYASASSPWQDMMFAHNQGILVFTGHDWELIDVPENSSIRVLTVDDNLLLAGGKNIAGYIDTDEKGMYRFVPMINTNFFPLMVKEMACRDSVVFIRGKEQILMHDLKTGKTLKRKVNTESRFLEFNRQKYLFIKKQGLFELNPLWFNTENPQPLMNTESLFFTLAEELNHALTLVYDENKGFLRFDINSKTIEKWNNQLEGSPVFGKPGQIIKLQNEDKFLIVHTKGIAMVSENGEINQVFDKNNLLSENIIHHIYQDHRGNLWLNINDGVLYLEWSSPFREINTDAGFEGYPGFSAFCCDRIYLGTTSGFYQTSENPMKNQEKKTFIKTVDATPLHYHKAEDRLWVGFNDAVIQFPHGDTVLPYAVNTIATAKENPEILYAASGPELFRVVRDNEKHKPVKIKGFSGTIKQMVVQSSRIIWVKHEDGGIARLELSDNKDSVESVKPLKDYIPKAKEAEWNLHGTCQNLPVLSGAKGYYRFNPTHDQFEVITTLNDYLPPVKMDILKCDRDGKYWFWRNKAPSLGGFAGQVLDGVVIDTLRFKRLLEYEVSDIDIAYEKALFTINNKLVFYIPSRYNSNRLLEVYLSRIEDILHDTLIRQNPLQNHQQHVNLSAFQNNLRFVAHTNLFTSTGRMQYSFYLGNHDEKWSHWQNNQFKDYTSLSPGNYILHIKALDFHGHISEIPPVSIHIKAPWYTSVYAFVAYGLIALVVLIGIIEHNKKTHRRKTLQLEQLVQRRTQELIVQREAIRKEKDKISEMNQTKDKFFSIIAHDLRSPFNSLLGLSSILKEDFDDLTEDEKKDMIEHIHKTSNLSFNLLDNLLAWSRTQRDKVEIYRGNHDLTQVVQETIHLMQSSADAKNIYISNLIRRSYMGCFDRNMVLTIIRNLLSNAIKFTHDGGLIELDITEDKSHLRFMVKDNGMGMSDKELKNLFDMENQVRRKGTNNEAGTGLGMILCKDFAERNNGSLIVESEYQKGSTFTLTLPKEPESNT